MKMVYEELTPEEDALPPSNVLVIAVSYAQLGVQGSDMYSI
jgi:hypothetical protein